MFIMKKLISANPAKNYAVLGEVAISTETEIAARVKSAKKAAGEWRAAGVGKRVEALAKVYSEFERRKDELALLATREMGMPIAQSAGDYEAGLYYFNWFLQNADKHLAPEITYEDDAVVHKVIYEPIGAAAVIVPWNAPMSNFVWRNIQNLLVGNTVIFKASEGCPLFGQEIERNFKIASFPERVFNTIYGDGKTGDILVHQDIDIICFTGSSKVGSYLYELAAKKFIKVSLELGGSSPGIVFEDANIDKIVDSICANRFNNCGQICFGLKRLIVHESKYAELARKLKALIEAKKVGDPEDEKTDIGPLANEKQLTLLKAQVEDAINGGAKIIAKGAIPENVSGAYHEPMLLGNINRNMRVWKEEVFGPVLPAVTFKTEKEAIELANDTEYGLGGFVYTENKDRFLKVASQIEAGMVGMNNAMYLDPSTRKTFRMTSSFPPRAAFKMPSVSGLSRTLRSPISRALERLYFAIARLERLCLAHPGSSTRFLR